MSATGSYTPRYIETSDVPLSSPDSYSQTEKRRAIFHAETSLELDVNNGRLIEDDSLMRAHRAAVINLATHVLTHSAEEPSNVRLGDMSDDGGTITNYSSRYLDEYKRLVDRIQETGAGNAETGNYTATINSGNPEDSDYHYHKDTGGY